MFESALLSTARPAFRRPTALPLSLALHAAAALAVLGAALWRGEELAAPPSPVTFVERAPAPPPAGSRSGAERRAAAAVASPRRLSSPAGSLAERLAPAPSSDAVSSSMADEIVPGFPFGDEEGEDGGTGEVTGATTKGPGTGREGDGPIVIGGDVKAPAIVLRVEPDYPEIARKAGAQGVVILQAVIGTGGEIEDLRVVKPLFPPLDESALAAVRQWRYRAATLNGRAVRVYVTVTVDFRLR